VDAVTDHVSRNPLGHCHQLAVDHQHPVVLAGDEALHDHAAAVFPGNVECRAHLIGGGEMNRDASSVVGVERLHHHGEPDSVRCRDRIIGVLHQALLGNRQTEIAQQPVGLLLIGGQLDRDV
jgi:hypothetical protein